MSLDILFLHASFRYAKCNYYFTGSHATLVGLQRSILLFIWEITAMKNLPRLILRLIGSKVSVYFYLFWSKCSISVCEKRLSAGWMTYSLIEIKQRYHIKGPVSCNVDLALADYHLQIRDGFYRAWSKHSCNVSFTFCQARSTVTSS